MVCRTGRAGYLLRLALASALICLVVSAGCANGTRSADEATPAESPTAEATPPPIPVDIDKALAQALLAPEDMPPGWATPVATASPDAAPTPTATGGTPAASRRSVSSALEFCQQRGMVGRHRAIAAASTRFDGQGDVAGTIEQCLYAFAPDDTPAPADLGLPPGGSGEFTFKQPNGESLTMKVSPLDLPSTGDEMTALEATFDVRVLGRVTLDIALVRRGDLEDLIVYMMFGPQGIDLGQFAAFVGRADEKAAPVAAALAEQRTRLAGGLLTVDTLGGGWAESGPDDRDGMLPCNWQNAPQWDAGVDVRFANAASNSFVREHIALLADDKMARSYMNGLRQAYFACTDWSSKDALGRQTAWQRAPLWIVEGLGDEQFAAVMIARREGHPEERTSVMWFRRGRLISEVRLIEEGPGETDRAWLDSVFRDAFNKLYWTPQTPDGG